MRFLYLFLRFWIFAARMPWQWSLCMSLYTYKSLLPQFCVNKVHSCLSTPTSPCCHSGVSITFRMVYLHLPILYATAMSITCLTTPLHPDVLCYHCTVSVDVDNLYYYTCTQSVRSVVVIHRSLYSLNSLLLQSCALPCMSQLQVIATLINIMQKKQQVSLKNQFIHW